MTCHLLLALEVSILLGVTRLIPKWRSQLDPELARVEVWDNTLMLTPREHFRRVAKQLREMGRPGDIVCGVAPGGGGRDGTLLEDQGWRIRAGGSRLEDHRTP